MLQVVQHLFQAGLEIAIAAAPLAPPAPPLVSYEDLVATPERFVGQEVRVHLQKRAIAEEWQPFLTRFVPARYLALDAWSDVQLPWVQADYDLPRARVFVPRDTPAARRVLRAPLHRRLLITCVVREHLAGQPWIEVRTVIPTRASIPEGTLLHVIRADGFVAKGSWSLASAELGRALSAPLPRHAAAPLEERKRALDAHAKQNGGGSK